MDFQIWEIWQKIIAVPRKNIKGKLSEMVLKYLRSVWEMQEAAQASSRAKSHSLAESSPGEQGSIGFCLPASDGWGPLLCQQSLWLEVALGVFDPLYFQLNYDFYLGFKCHHLALQYLYTVYEIQYRFVDS